MLIFFFNLQKAPSEGCIESSRIQFPIYNVKCLIVLVFGKLVSLPPFLLPLHASNEI